MRATMESRLTRSEPPGPAAASSPVLPSTVWFGPTMPQGTAKELIAFLGSHDGVAVVYWPRDAEIVGQLTKSGLPRLLLVKSPTNAPAHNGPLQDWILWPATQEAMHERLMTLSRRSIERRLAAGVPTVDDRGQVHRGDDVVELAPFERWLAGALLARFEEPITEDVLRAMAGGPPVSRTSLRGRAARLSEDINPLGLEVVSVGGDAYAMRRCITQLTECAA